MDPMAQAFAYYNFNGTAGRDQHRHHGVHRRPGAAQVLHQLHQLSVRLRHARRQLVEPLAPGPQRAVRLGHARCPAAATAPSRSARRSNRAACSHSARCRRCSRRCASARRRRRPTRRRSRSSPTASRPAATNSSRRSSRPLPPARASKGAPAMNRNPLATVPASAARLGRLLQRAPRCALLAVLAACSGGGRLDHGESAVTPRQQRTATTPVRRRPTPTSVLQDQFLGEHRVRRTAAAAVTTRVASRRCSRAR